MGWYIQTSSPIDDKATELIAKHKGRIITQLEARELVYSTTEGVVCCVSNHGLFEAAGFCFDLRELEAFTEPGDTRRKTWIALPLDVCERESGMLGACPSRCRANHGG